MPKLLITSVGLLLLTNIVVLAGVAYNRSGEPLISIELTERELPIMQSYNSREENSGTMMSLRWQILDPDEDIKYVSTTYGTPAWLDDDKLIELGFDIAELNSDADKYQYKTGHFSRKAILVLEYQGESYQKALKLAEGNLESAYADELEDYENQLAQLKISRTHLYVVDAGQDRDLLIQKYADKGNYLLVRGEIGLRWSGDIVYGRIRQLYLNQVHVPLPLSEQLISMDNGETYSPYNNLTPPRYKVRLNIGKRLEPWIKSIELIQE